MNAIALTVAFLLSFSAAPRSARKLKPVELKSVEKNVEKSVEKSVETRPWYQNVAPEARDSARALFKEANSLFNNGLLGKAEPKYLEALKLWDHPNIHYNLALTQMNIDQPVEAHAHFLASTKYGDAPLPQEIFNLAKTFTATLQRQLTRLQVRCDEPGARVELDGQSLFVGPGNQDMLIRPGPHVILATKQGLLDNEVARRLEAGTTVALNLRLATDEEMTLYQRRWSPAVPWTVLTAGAVVAATGGGLFYAGLKMKSDAERTVLDRCSEGCVPPIHSASDKKVESARLQRIAIGTIAVGGTALITGAVLQLLNRTHPARRAYDVDVPAEQKLTIAPILDDSTRGAMATVRF